MRKILALVVALAAVVAACGGQATTNDPYELLNRSQSANWDRVQVDIGVVVSGPDAFTLEPGALRFAVDSKAGKANVHIAFPISVLGEEAAQLRALGIGETLELDVIFDGQALYAKSPLGTLLAALMIQSGEIPSGDMTGWLQLLSKADIEALGSLGGGLVPVPLPDDLPIPSAADVASLKSALDEMGVSLTHAGTVSRNGADVEKVSAAIDLAKLAQSEYLDQLGSGAPMDFDPADGTLAADLYFDRGNSRLVGLDIHAASKSDPNEKADIAINLREPDASVSFDAPGSFVEVPLMEMLSTLMEAFGGGMF